MTREPRETTRTFSISARFSRRKHRRNVGYHPHTSTEGFVMPLVPALFVLAVIGLIVGFVIHLPILWIVCAIVAGVTAVILVISWGQTRSGSTRV